MSNRNSSQRPSQPQQEPDSDLLAAIIQSLLDEFGLTTHYQDLDKSSLDFLELLRQKLGSEHDVTKLLADKVEAYLSQHNIEVSAEEQRQLSTGLITAFLGLGPIEPLLADESISAIMVNGPYEIYVERRGKLEKINLSFESDDHLMHILSRIVSPSRRRLDESSPMADVRLPDGSHANVTIAPVSLVGPTLTIRKFSKGLLTFDNLLAWGVLNEDIVDFLKACVMARLNIIVAGGVNSGKTTLLNIISGFIPDGERVVTVEEIAEFRLRHWHVVTLESHRPNIEGKGEITVRDLVINCRRMRPDRVLVGELNGPEVLEVLRLMDKGYDGTMTTIFANSPQEALERIEMMVKMSEPNLPMPYLRSLIGSTVDVVVQQNRLEDGSRKVVRVTEVLPVRGGDYDLRDVFLFLEEGYDEQGRVKGSFQARPVSDRLRRRMEALGITLTPELVAVVEEEAG